MKIYDDRNCSRMTEATNTKIVSLIAATLFLCVAAIIVPAQQRTSSTVSQSTQDAPRRTNRRDAPAETAAPALTASDAATTTRFGYEFIQPQFVIDRISITHDAATGQGRMTFTRRDDKIEYNEPVQLSPPALARIRNLWTQLGDLRTSTALQAAKQFPHLGTIKLSVTDTAGARSTEFNWTETRAASDLAKEYRRLADQTLFIFDIGVARENQPLEAPALLKRLEILQRRGELSDPAQLLPFLRELATDERLPLIARNQADKIAKKIAK